jgi:hypothetical protein
MTATYRQTGGQKMTSAISRRSDKLGTLAQRNSRARAYGWRSALAATGLGTLAMLSVALAPSGAAAAACATSITACGCTITTGGTTYSVANDLSFSGTSGACITVAASNLILEGSFHTISGSSSSASTIGVEVASTAKTVLFGDMTVTGFGQGIRLDGRDAVLATSTVSLNGRGVVVNGPAAFLSGVTADANNLAGIQVNSAAVGSTLLRVTADSNFGAGIKLVNVNGVSLVEADASTNSTFGVWLNGSSSNFLWDFTAEDNTIAGVYLGCNAAGPTGAACPPGTLPASANMISGDLVGSTNSVVSPSSPSKQKFGVAIDLGNGKNRVMGVTGKGNGIFDAIDKNASCATNLWLATFTTVSPTLAASGNLFCIQ